MTGKDHKKATSLGLLQASLIAIGVLLVVVYLALSVATLTGKDPIAFARAGSVGVASAFWFFLTLKFFHDFFDQRQEYFDYMLLHALDSMEMKIDAVSRNQSHELFITGVTGLKEFAKGKFPFGRVAQGLNSDLKLAINIQKRRQRVLNTWALFELLIVVTATLQWGYGDMFHCWLNGHGWAVCG